MAKLSDSVIPYSRLSFAEDGQAVITAPVAAMEPEVIAALLTRVVRHVATAAADGQDVQPVTLNVNVTGRASTDETLRFQADIDRRTRTLIFISGAARTDEQIILAVTGVYRIVSGQSGKHQRQ